MSTLKKPRCDSVLKNLPPDRQAEIFEHAKTNGLIKTAAWLKEDGVDTSKSAVGDFCSWYQVKEQKARNESAVTALIADLARDNPTWTAEQLQQAGNAFFSALAIQQQNTDDWVSTQRLQLDRDKFEELKRKADKADAAKKVTESKLSPEEQRQRLKEILK